MSSYKSTSLDRKRKHLPYLPDDVFHLVMHYRNRLMRRDAVRELRKEIESNKTEMKILEDEMSELLGDEDHDEDEEERLEELGEDLFQNAHAALLRIINLKELDDFWGLSQNRA